MKTMNRRPSTVMSRLLLAAFLFALPGSRESFAQVAGRVGIVGQAGVSGAVGSGLGSVTAAPGLSAPLSALNLSLSVPSAGAVAPMPAAAALAPAALKPSALIVSHRAAAVAFKPGVVVAAAVSKGADAAVAAPSPSAIASLISAAGGGKDGAAAQMSGRRFDGGGSRFGDDDGDDDGDSNSRALAVIPTPAEAPVIALSKIFFPGVNQIRFAIADANQNQLVTRAMRAGGMAIVTSAGADAEGNSPAAVLVKLSNAHMDSQGQASVLMTVLRTATITGYKIDGGVTLAKAAYPKMSPANPKRLLELGSLAQHTLAELARLDPSLDEQFVGHALMEEDPERLANLLSQELPLTDAVKLSLLSETSIEARLQAVILEMSGHFKEKTAKPAAPGASDPGSMSSDEALASEATLKAKMTAIGMPAGVQDTTLKEFAKLSQMNPKDAEAQKSRTYLVWLLDVPWGQRTEDNLNISDARNILDKDHFGLETVKERVLEFLALRKKTGSKKGAIIAFTGPPGVGKTSIAGAIAEALGRKFVRLSLGGVHDESVIRGHGRTYLGC